MIQAYPRNSARLIGSYKRLWRRSRKYTSLWTFGNGSTPLPYPDLSASSTSTLVRVQGYAQTFYGTATYYSTADPWTLTNENIKLSATSVTISLGVSYSIGQIATRTLVACATLNSTGSGNVLKYEDRIQLGQR